MVVRYAVWLLGYSHQCFLMQADDTNDTQVQLYYLYYFPGLGHAWLLGNSRTRQNAPVSSLNVCVLARIMSPSNLQSIYAADDMYNDTNI